MQYAYIDGFENADEHDVLELGPRATAFLIWENRSRNPLIGFLAR